MSHELEPERIALTEKQSQKKKKATEIKYDFNKLDLSEFDYRIRGNYKSTQLGMVNRLRKVTPALEAGGKQSIFGESLKSPSNDITPSKSPQKQPAHLSGNAVDEKYTYNLLNQLKNRQEANNPQPNSTPEYQFILNQYRYIWEKYFKEDELLVINNWKCLYQIVTLLKRKFNDEHRNSYIGFLHLDLVSPKKKKADDGGVASMEGELTHEDQQRF